MFRCLTLAVTLFCRLWNWKYVGRTHDRRESCKYRPKYPSFYITFKLCMKIHSEIKCVYPNEVRENSCEQCVLRPEIYVKNTFSTAAINQPQGLHPMTSSVLIENIHSQFVFPSFMIWNVNFSTVWYSTIFWIRSLHLFWHFEKMNANLWSRNISSAADRTALVSGTSIVLVYIFRYVFSCKL